MILEEVGILCIANNRSRYYVTSLLENDLRPNFVLLLQNPEDIITPWQRRFDLGSDFVQLLEEAGLDFEIIPSIKVNSCEVIEALKTRPEQYFIYSGPGGVILRKEILNIGKKFLHVHPGRVPDFRGSTTVYYQLLSEGTCSASAIFLSESIDTGPLLGSGTFKVPKGVDLDYEFDPEIRSRVLINVIKEYARSGCFTQIEQCADSGETYFIMHPVLRHIAKLMIQ